MIEYNEERKLENGTYYIRNKQYGTYFQNNGQNNNTTLSGFTGASNQQWRITEDSNNDYSYYISPMEQQHVLVTGQQMNSPPIVVIQTGGPTPGMRSRIVSNYDNTSSPDGSFRIMSVAYKNLSIHAANPGTCTMYPYTASDVCRNWEFEKVVDDGVYYIKNNGSGLYLTAGANWFDLTQQNLSGEATQQVKLTCTNGRHRMQPLSRTGTNVSIPDSLDVLGGAQYGGSVIITSNNNTAAQSWAFVALPGGGYRIRPDCGMETSLSVAGNPPGIGSNLQTQMASSSNFQVWELEECEPISDGIYYIRNKQTGNYLRPNGNNSTTCGAGAWNGLNEQQWEIKYQGDGLYRLYSQHPTQGNTIILYSNTSDVRVSTSKTDHTLFYLQRNTDGTFRVLSAKTNDSLQNASGANCYWASNTANNDQKWEIARKGALCYVKNAKTELYMTANNNNYNVTQQTKNNLREQKWWVTYNNGKYRLQPAIHYTSTSLTVSSGLPGISFVNISGYTDYSDQSWSIEYISYGKYKLKPDCGNNTALSIDGESLIVGARTKTDYSSNSDFQIWEFEILKPKSQYNVIVNNYFDEGFALRHGNISPQNEDDARTTLSINQALINAVLQDQFGAMITSSTQDGLPEPYTSYADNCTDNPFGIRLQIEYQCTIFVPSGKFCCFPNIHCKNVEFMLYQNPKGIPAESGVKTILYTGHETCSGSCTATVNSGRYNGCADAVNGARLIVSIPDNYDPDPNKPNKDPEDSWFGTGLHELAHTLGAYHCSDKDCIMGGLLNPKRGQRARGGNYKLFCYECHTSIENHLYRYY